MAYQEGKLRLPDGRAVARVTVRLVTRGGGPPLRVIGGTVALSSRRQEKLLPLGASRGGCPGSHNEWPVLEEVGKVNDSVHQRLHPWI